MKRYIGYFNGLDGTRYSVKIEGSDSYGSYTEILLAGDAPFTVTYDTNSTCFEPLRTSRATIKIVHNDYLEDILPSAAHDTKVILSRIVNNTETVEWCGYLTPRIYDQGYTYEYEDIELEAADCLSSLQYFDYETVTPNTKAIVTVHSIISRICSKCGMLDRFMWTRSKSVGNVVMLPEHLKISEQNFVFEDTKENWNMRDVLEEICRYFGFTCMQWKDRLYFIDYQYLTDNERLSMTQYVKGNNYAQGSTTYLDSPFTITEDTYRGADSTITFEPVYNLIRVNDNFYTCDELLPEIFDDQYLTNRLDSEDFYADFEVSATTPYNAPFPKKLKARTATYSEEDASDYDYRYFYRLYNHKYWESNYYSASGATIPPLPPYMQCTSAITKNYMGGTIVDLGVVHRNSVSEYGDYIQPNRRDFTRYLCLSNKFNELNYVNSRFPSPRIYTGPFTLFKLKDGFAFDCPVSPDSYLVINYSQIWERYSDRAYINPDWSTEPCGADQLSGDIYRRPGSMQFIFAVGNKWWNGERWVSTGTPQSFLVAAERESENIDTWNTEQHTLNNIGWEMEVDAEGYKIPLSGIDMTQQIRFEVTRPRTQFDYEALDYDKNRFYQYNAYTWIKNLSIKIVQGGENHGENDVVYTNIIDNNAVSELQDIEVKLTTYTPLTKPAYSNVVYSYNGNTSLLQEVKEPSIQVSGGTRQPALPEVNIIDKWYEEYSTPTRKLTLTQPITITPFNKVYGANVDNINEPYVVLGQTLDYREGSQKITLLEKK